MPPRTPRTTAPVADRFNGADPAKFDHDNSGQPGGSLPHTAAVPPPPTAPAAEPSPPITPDVAVLAATPPEPIDIDIEAEIERRVAERLAAADATAEEDAIATLAGPVADDTGEERVRVRITKAGDGQVHTGLQDPKTYAWAEEVMLPRGVGLALEGRHFGEIL